MSAAPQPLLGLSGIRMTIIDYTFSRAAPGPEEVDIIFDPFKDASFFTAYGKTPEEKRQCHSYRSMHRCVVAADIAARADRPCTKEVKETVDMWSRFVPKTNVVWLRYILCVLLLRANRKILPKSNKVAERLQNEMYRTLEGVANKLQSKKLLSSAKELLAVAEDNLWLSGEDTRGFRVQLEKEA
jgi:midasin (ATPase involved in ribosome maturation)